MADSENKNPEKIPLKRKREDKFQRLLSTLSTLAYLLFLTYTPLPPEFTYKFALLGVAVSGGYTSWKTIQNLKEGN